MDEIQNMSSIFHRFNISEQSNWNEMLHDTLVPTTGKVGSQSSLSNRYVQPSYKDQCWQNDRFITSDIWKCKKLRNQCLMTKNFEEINQYSKIACLKMPLFFFICALNKRTIAIRNYKLQESIVF